MQNLQYLWLCVSHSKFDLLRIWVLKLTGLVKLHLFGEDVLT